MAASAPDTYALRCVVLPKGAAGTAVAPPIPATLNVDAALSYRDVVEHALSARLCEAHDQPAESLDAHIHVSLLEDGSGTHVPALQFAEIFGIPLDKPLQPRLAAAITFVIVPDEADASLSMDVVNSTLRRLQSIGVSQTVIAAQTGLSHPTLSRMRNAWVPVQAAKRKRLLEWAAAIQNKADVQDMPAAHKPKRKTPRIRFSASDQTALRQWFSAAQSAPTRADIETIVEQLNLARIPAQQSAVEPSHIRTWLHNFKAQRRKSNSLSSDSLPADTVEKDDLAATAAHMDTPDPDLPRLDHPDDPGLDDHSFVTSSGLGVGVDADSGMTPYPHDMRDLVEAVDAVHAT